MQRFTDDRQGSTPDEIWFVEHPPVFTLGLNASREHVLCPGDIPVVQIDRGGQVTYHGPGQLVVYPLIDLRRRPLGVRELVVALENAIIAYVAELGIDGDGFAAGARGVCRRRQTRQRRITDSPRRRVITDWRSTYRSICNPSGINVGHRGLASRLADRMGVCRYGRGCRDGHGGGLTPHLLRQLKFGTDYSAISTDLQAVNSR